MYIYWAIVHILLSVFNPRENIKKKHTTIEVNASIACRLKVYEFLKDFDFL